MTTNPNPTKAAADMTTADRIIVSSRLAAYWSKPDLAGTALRVTKVRNYGGGVIGITLRGLPETCARHDAMIEVAR